MKDNIFYSALFIVNPADLLKIFPPKHKNIYAHHSTIEFKPSKLEGIELGKSWKIKIIGRAIDEKGDALLVENSKSKNKFPHITISCADGVAPVYSNELLEKASTVGAIEYFDPIFIDAVEGYETDKREVILC